MEFRILGPLEVSHDGDPVPVTGTRQRELLALLLLHAGQVVSTGRLMDELWGESQPAAGSAALRVRVSQLRRALGPGGKLLVTRPPGYALLVSPEAVDLWCFERHLAEATRHLRGGDPAAARDTTRAGLALWRGAPLADFAYASFAQAAIGRLEEMRSAALELRIAAELALGHHAQLVAELQELVAAYPLRERFWAHLMVALYRDGRQAEALAAYSSARARLVEEIGIEPGPELQALQAQILAQDPYLGGSGEAAPSAAPRRAVLALVDQRSFGGVARLAESLAAQGGHELIVAELVERSEAVASATERLNELRAAVSSRGVVARAVAFTSRDRGADVLRLAAEQDAAILVVGLPEEAASTGAIRGDFRGILSGAMCDVAAVAGAAQDPPRPGPVLVPFAGNEHDWSAAETGAWLAGGAPLRLLGVTARGRDASRMLASASLALQRGMGVTVEPVLVPPGADAVVAAADAASAVVVGLSDRWQREGLGDARLALARRAPCPVLLMRRGLRPSGLAPPDALTRFAWSSGG